jgi:nicotinamidase-related amidase
MPLTIIDPQTALVLVDLQNGFRHRPAGPNTAEDVVSRSVALAEAFRARELPVVLTRFVMASGGANAPGRTDLSGHFSEIPEAMLALVDDLAGHPGDITITKRGWDSFYGTDLNLLLRGKGVTQVVLAGVATSIGVESTARTAHEHGYNVTLATDAMTDLNPQAHEHTTQRIFPMLGETGTAEEVIKLL